MTSFNRPGRRSLLLRGRDLLGDERSFRVTPNDMAEFLATHARNLVATE